MADAQKGMNRARRTSIVDTAEPKKNTEEMAKYMATRGQGGKRRSSAIGTEDMARAAEAQERARRTSIADTGNPNGEATLTTYMAGRGQGGQRRESAVGTDDLAALAAASQAADERNDKKKSSYCVIA